jgi:hypothetical protein
MSRRLSRLLLPALAFAALFPGMALGGPTTAPGNSGCVASPPNIVVTNGQLSRIDASTQVVCTDPGNRDSNGMGSSQVTITQPPPPKPGQSCGYTVTVPVRFTFGSPVNNASNIGWQYMPGGPFPASSFQGGTWGFHDLAAFAGSDALATSTYQTAGLGTDYFFPWVFHGTWTNPPPLTCKPDPNFSLAFGLNPGWSTPCAGIGQGWTVPQCLLTQTPGVTISRAKAQADAGALAQSLGLAGLLKGRFNGGQISSTPANPNPGLVNTDTCFFVTGLTADGRPLATNTGIVTSFQITLMDPNAADAEFRHVVYTFRIDILYNDTTWDFGNGVTMVNPPSAQGLPCDTLGAAAQLSAAFKFTKYSLKQPNGVYVVQAQHHYGIHVTAWWRDSNGSNSVDLGTAGVNGINVDALSEPIQIVQEEGVPVP